MRTRAVRRSVAQDVRLLPCVTAVQSGGRRLHGRHPRDKCIDRASKLDRFIDRDEVAAARNNLQASIGYSSNNLETVLFNRVKTIVLSRENKGRDGYL